MAVAEGAPSLNTTLEGLTDVAGAALRVVYPDIAVYPYARVIDPAQTFPVLAACPFADILEETFTGLRGNRPTHDRGKGNSIFTLIYLQAPAITISTPADDGAAQQALYAAVDVIKNAFVTQQRTLPDAQGNDRAQDAGSVMIAHFPQQGPPIQFQSSYYVGCLITVEVWEIDRP